MYDLLKRNKARLRHMNIWLIAPSDSVWWHRTWFRSWLITRWHQDLTWIIINVSSKNPWRKFHLHICQGTISLVTYHALPKFHTMSYWWWMYEKKNSTCFKCNLEISRTCDPRAHGAQDKRPFESIFVQDMFYILETTWLNFTIQYWP